MGSEGVLHGLGVESDYRFRSLGTFERLGTVDDLLACQPVVGHESRIQTAKFVAEWPLRD
jgi:hypothetical protein